MNLHQKQHVTSLKTKDFDSLEREERAMLLASDVLDLVKKKAIKPIRGQYLDGKAKIEQIQQYALMKRSADRTFKNVAVCSIGSFFVAALNNDTKECIKAMQDFVDNTEEQEGIVNLLPSKINPENIVSLLIGKDNMAKIDAAYEFNELMEAGVFAGVEDCIKFGSAIKNDKKRLVAIMENIIDNEGDFDPLNVVRDRILEEEKSSKKIQTTEKKKKAKKHINANILEVDDDIKEEVTAEEVLEEVATA